jgi:hypothetical protein
MSLRAQLIREIAELAEDDVRALLALVGRLRARQEPASPVAPPAPGGTMLHPERFGALPGSVRFLGDVESPVAEPGLWTFDGENVGS